MRRLRNALSMLCCKIWKLKVLKDPKVPYIYILSHLITFPAEACGVGIGSLSIPFSHQSFLLGSAPAPSIWISYRPWSVHHLAMCRTIWLITWLINSMLIMFYWCGFSVLIGFSRACCMSGIVIAVLLARAPWHDKLEHSRMWSAHRGTTYYILIVLNMY